MDLTTAVEQLFKELRTDVMGQHELTILNDIENNVYMLIA